MDASDRAKNKRRHLGEDLRKTKKPPKTQEVQVPVVPSAALYPLVTYPSTPATPDYDPPATPPTPDDELELRPLLQVSDRSTLYSRERALIFLFRQTTHGTNDNKLKDEIVDARMFELSTITYSFVQRLKSDLLDPFQIQSFLVCAECGAVQCNHPQRSAPAVPSLVIGSEEAVDSDETITVDDEPANVDENNDDAPPISDDEVVFDDEQAESDDNIVVDDEDEFMDDVDVGVSSNSVRPPKASTKLAVRITTCRLLPQLQAIYTRNREYLKHGIDLTINVDGVQPRDHKKKPFWSLIACIQNLPTHLIGLRENMCVVGVACGKDVKTEHLELLAKQMKDDLSGREFNFHYNGKTDRVRVTVKHGTMDIPAAQKAFTLGSYLALNVESCRYCLCKAFRGKKRRTQLWQVHGAFIPRDRHNLAGTRRRTVFMDLLSLIDIRQDYLHIADEGITKRFSTFFFEQRKNPLFLGVTFKNALLAGYSTCGGRIASTETDYLSRYGELCGHDVRYLFHDSFPHILINLWTANHENHYKLAVIFAYWIVSRTFVAKPDTRTLLKTADIIESVSEHVHHAFGEDVATIKAHLFFQHAPEQIRMFGNVSDFSASHFEAFNFLLQKGICTSNTKDYVASMLKTHVLRLGIREYVQTSAPSQKFYDWLRCIDEPTLQFTSFPESRRSTLTQFVEIAATMTNTDPKDLKLVSKLRIGADLVFVTNSPYFLKILNPLRIIKPILGFSIAGHFYVLAVVVKHTDPFINLLTQTNYTFLRGIGELQTFVFSIERIPPINYSTCIVVPSNLLISYLFPFRMNNCNFLIEGSEYVTKV